MMNPGPDEDDEQKAIRLHVEHVVDYVVQQAESYRRGLDRNYFLGLTAVPLLIAAHCFAQRERSVADADLLLDAQLRSVAEILGKETGRKISIQVARSAL